MQSFTSCLTLLQEELVGVIKAYERRGYFDDVLALLEAGLSLERAHVRLHIDKPFAQAYMCDL